MENTQLPQNPPRSDVPDLPPGTFEYVDPKKSRKKIFEICAIVLIASVPLVLSLVKLPGPVQRMYEVISPDYVSTNPSYQSFGGFISEAQKIFNPIANIIQPEPSPTPLLSPTITPVEQSQPVEYVYPTQTQSQNNNQTETQEPDYYSPQYEEAPDVYPTHEYVYPSSTPTTKPTATPTTKPTATMTPFPDQSNEEIPQESAFSACEEKKKGWQCSYLSSNGHRIYGICKQSYGTLICSPN